MQQNGTQTPTNKAKLQDGDIDLIADITDFSASYVRKCLSGNRHNAIISTVSEALISNRVAFVRDIKKVAQLVRKERNGNKKSIARA